MQARWSPVPFIATTRLIASLAGGRKTMGALLYAALSLLGRRQDRLTHVLVNEPFDDPRLAPRFYFPLANPVPHQLTDRAGKVVSEHTTSEADPRLADVPFVRSRNLFPRQLGRWPGRFNALVQIFSERVDQLAGPPGGALGFESPGAGRVSCISRLTVLVLSWLQVLGPMDADRKRLTRSQPSISWVSVPKRSASLSIVVHLRFSFSSFSFNCRI